MKNRITIFSLAVLLAGATGCDKKDGIDDDLSFVTSASAPTNSNRLFDITNDNSGVVRITPTGTGAASYTVNFGHGTGSGALATVMPGSSASHAYPEGTYTVSIVSTSSTGQTTTNTYPLTVTYRAPENIMITKTVVGNILKVKATALYAASYLVYFGDVANETGTPLATGAEVQHSYAAGGNYNIKVVALSGGAARSEKTESVSMFDPYGLPITFELATTNYEFGTFGGGQQFAKVANPNPSGLNTSATVGKFTRGWEAWSGTYSPLSVPINMTAGKKIRVLVYNPDPAMIGKKLNIELEYGTIANGIAVLQRPVTTSGAWEELVFDFGTIAAIPSNPAFTQLVLRYSNDIEGNVPGGQGSVIYVDNFRITN